MAGDLAALEAALGHVFGDRELLERALTHKSRAHEQHGDPTPSSNNEQLEFLGDAILGFVVSECLVRRYADAPEGRLSKLKAHLVSAARLYEVAVELELGDFLFLGRGEEMSGGRAKKALLADAVEALIAALYLDAGLHGASAFIEKCVIGPLDSAQDADGLPADFKSTLQEVAQSLGLPMPRYMIVGEVGPEHAKTFTVEARLSEAWVSRAEGPSKKAAGQRAAQGLLEQLSQSQPAE